MWKLFKLSSASLTDKQKRLELKGINFWELTLRKTKIALENSTSQKETSIPTCNHPFSGAMLVSGRVVI